MKRLLTVLLMISLLCVCAFAVSAAPDEPVITLQPQSPNYPEYSVAMYTVRAEGTNMTATWYMTWNGDTYTISNIGQISQAWEGFAGSSYGPRKVDDKTFIYTFEGIGKELNGAEIWCVLEDGHYSVSSQKAYVSVGEASTPPTIVSIPSSLTLQKGESGEIRCIAQAPGQTQLSFLWYESDTGRLQDIRALNRGEETADYLILDTSTVGTRNYLCMVSTTEGGVVYSSFVTVTVTEKAVETDPPATAETQKPVAPDEPARTEPTTEATEKVTEKVTEQTDDPRPDATNAVDISQTVEADKDETAAKPDETSEPTQNDEKEDSAGAPLWVLVLVGVVAAGAGVGVALLIVKKK